MPRPTRAKCVNVRLCVAADDNRTGLYATKNYFGRVAPRLRARASVISLIYARYKGGGEETRESERKSVDITKSRGSRQHLVIYPTFLYILHYR